MRTIMTEEEMVDWIFARGHRLFSVRFIKRGDGTLREMVCRLDVKRHLAGGERAYDPAEKDLIWVWEPAIGPRKKGDRGYRSIPIEGVLEVKSGDEWIQVEQEWDDIGRLHNRQWANLARALARRAA